MTDILVKTATTAPEINAILDYPYPGVEDDGEISCFCGLNDDDGNTVACDICNKWQHIRCYYPQWAESKLPDEIQHFCVECRPRTFDAQGALERQLHARNRKELNGVKRLSKPKKKSINGFREDGPPTKRPKTMHRGSGPQRKRSASTIHRSSESPESTTQTYSPEFLSAYLNDEYTTTNVNCFDNLEIGAKLSSWLGNSDEVFQITDGMGLRDIFQRYDGDMDVIDPPVDLIEVSEVHDERFKVNGESAMWKVATLKDPLTTQACIGELRGNVGFKEDYKADAANRWPILRHPEPFVFFHPNLPICIDARHEGTLMRYVRRSCDPNAELKVIITGAADYHFCFIATRDIAAGEEVAIAWDCARTIRDMLSREGMDAVQAWVSIVLSNCGPCACKRQECLMAHFDKRLPSIRPQKTRRKKEHVSPIITNAVDSRSGSEARNFEDDEGDSRSATGFDSRDITPNTHYSANGHPEISERERKKLLREEEMFRRQEEQGAGKQSKKKRTSGGHNLDIPRPSTAKSSPGISKKPDASNGRKRRKAARTPTIQRAQSTYVDASVQCELDPHMTIAASRRTSTITRRRMNPLRQQLFNRCAQTNAMWYNALNHERSLRKDVPAVNDALSTAMETEDAVAMPISPTMKLEMPPPEPQQWTATPVVETPGAVTQSAAAFLMSPSIQTSLNTPAKKKLSLSDYTKRSKAKETEVKNDRESSPSSAVSAKENLPAVTEDVIMEDSTDPQ